MTGEGPGDSIQILFLTRSLNYGGSERQLIALATGLRQKGESLAVATFYSGGPLRRELESEGVLLFSLEKRSRWDVFGFWGRLFRLVRKLRPAILHGYLGSANILTVLMKPLFPSMRIVWGVRASNMELVRYGWLDRFLYQIECALSRFADLIIVNSHAGFDYALAHGFPHNKMVVIPNGIDVERFRPNPEAGKRVRRAWGIGDGERVVGLVARLDPIKGHDTFLRAAALLLKERQDVRFVCVGTGSEQCRSVLVQFAQEIGLGNHLIWAGLSTDLPAVHSAMDIVCSSSNGEGFPNSIGEAMACGVPCVVSDVGDSALIVGDTGEVVPPRNPRDLADGWDRLLGRLRREPNLGAQARARIIQRFRLDTLVERTHAVLSGLQQCRPS